MDYTERFEKELSRYMPPLTKRPDFDRFWEETISKTRAVPLNMTRKLYDYPSPYATVYEITYNGFDETVIHGWYIIPSFVRKDKYPCLIHYHGYGGSRGRPADFMHWVNMGVAVVSVDCRGQCGNTGNSMPYSGGSTQSVVTKGILDKNEYYFRALYMDAVKAIDFACAQEEVDKSRIIIEGGSQGGALGVAVSALDSRPWLAMVDVPSNSNIEKRVEGFHGAFANVADFLKVFPDRVDKVFETLSYFDTMNMADRIKCKILASVGLRDNVCPAECFFATYNRITSDKQIRIYPFNGHEGGGRFHEEVKMRFLYENLNS